MLERQDPLERGALRRHLSSGAGRFPHRRLHDGRSCGESDAWVDQVMLRRTPPSLHDGGRRERTSFDPDHAEAVATIVRLLDADLHRRCISRHAQVAPGVDEHPGEPECDGGLRRNVRRPPLGEAAEVDPDALGQSDVTVTDLRSSDQRPHGTGAGIVITAPRSISDQSRSYPAAVNAARTVGSNNPPVAAAPSSAKPTTSANGLETSIHAPPERFTLDSSLSSRNREKRSSSRAKIPTIAWKASSNRPDPTSSANTFTSVPMARKDPFTAVMAVAPIRPSR